jgi:MarR family transcriptional regulator for hemolysin
VVVEDAVQEVRARMLADVSDEDLAATVRTFAAFEAALDAAAGQGADAPPCPSSTDGRCCSR